VITLDPMHDEQFTKMSTMGMTSQLTKLDKRFEKPSALPGVAVARASYQAYVDKDRQSQRCAALLLSKRRLIGSSHSGIRPWRSSSATCLIERSMAGLTAARAEGRTGGNRRKTTPADIVVARRHMTEAKLKAREVVKCTACQSDRFGGTLDGPRGGARRPCLDPRS